MMRVIIRVKVASKEKTQEYCLKSLEDTKSVIFKIVGLFPERKQGKVRTGLQELTMNAIEHGNLGINWEEKTNLKASRFRVYQDELNKRSGSKAYDDTAVHVTYDETEDRDIKLTIRDEGKGFDWKLFISKTMLDITDDQNHGRGIVMTKGSFNKLLYNECGNEVTGILSLR